MVIFLCIYLFACVHDFFFKGKLTYVTNYASVWEATVGCDEFLDPGDSEEGKGPKS